MFASLIPVLPALGSAPQLGVEGGAAKRLNGFNLFELSSQTKIPFNVIALIDQRDPFGSGWQRVKVVRSSGGTVVKSVLSPLKMQGIRSIDNGVIWQTVLPDERVVISQKSPTSDFRLGDLKFQLAKKNYAFSVNGTCSVAGRECYRVNVQPHHSELANWTLCLDAGTSYPLRMDSCNHGVSRVEFISRAVSFPVDLDRDLLVVEIPQGFKSLSYDCPEHLPSTYEASRKLGFLPLTPKHLPLGFQIQDMQLSKGESWKSLVFRLTDGMVRASVYEYLNDSGVNKIKPFDNSSSTTIGAIQIMLVSDLDKACREQILDCFSQQKDRTILSKP